MHGRKYIVNKIIAVVMFNIVRQLLLPLTFRTMTLHLANSPSPIDVNQEDLIEQTSCSSKLTQKKTMMIKSIQKF